MDWDDLRHFLAVGRTGSLRGAARLLSVNHATVRRRLEALESGLETRLFDRRREGLYLTEAGQELFGVAEEIDEQVRSAQTRVSGRESAPEGEVRISVPPALMRHWLPPHLAAFSQAFPGIRLLVSETDRFADFTRHETDISIRMAHQVEDDVAGRRLLQYARGIYAAPAYFRRDPADFVWLGWGDDSERPDWVRRTPFPEAPVRHQVYGHNMQIAAARAGLGLALLPCFLGETDPGLERARGTLPEPDRSLWLLLHPAVRRRARVRACVDFLAEAVLADRALFEGLA